MAKPIHKIPRAADHLPTYASDGSTIYEPTVKYQQSSFGVNLLDYMGGLKIGYIKYARVGPYLIFAGR